MVEVGRRRDEALDVGRVKEGFFATRLCKGTEGHDWRGLWGSVKGFCLVRFISYWKNLSISYYVRKEPADIKLQEEVNWTLSKVNKICS